MIMKHDQPLGTLIHDVAHLLRLDIDRRVAPRNLTRVKCLALGVLDRKPGITQADLAAEMELGTAAVGRLVDRLENRGFIIRSQAPGDRRAYTLSLTPAAKALVQTMDDTAAELREEILQGLSEREISLLNRGLAKLKDNLQRASTAALSIFVSVRTDDVADLQSALLHMTLA